MKPFKLKYNPINIDEKQFTKWLVALWGNKYPQTTETLQDDRGFCCLGVACEILIDNEDKILDSYGFLDSDLPKYQALSPYWLKKVNDDFCAITGYELTSLNDLKDFTFPEIADVLYQVYVLGECTTEGY